MTRYPPHQLRQMADHFETIEYGIPAAMLRQAADDCDRLDFLGNTCTGASDSERYLPFCIYWGGGQNKSIREAIDTARTPKEQTK